MAKSVLNAPPAAQVQQGSPHRCLEPDHPRLLHFGYDMIWGMAHIHDIVFDCHHPASIARFWAAALDDYEVAPYDEEELERLRGNGIMDPEDDPTVLVEGPGGGPRLFFQLVPEGKVVKNRVHLDLRCDSFDAEVKRLCALGASVHAEYDTFITLLDPEGNEFCVSRRAGN